MAQATIERVRELLHYEPETGIFTWRIRMGSNAPVGRAAGYLDPSHGYVYIGIDGARHYAHRVAWLLMTGVYPEDRVDHRNGTRSDNRWVNLRACTHAENNRNRAKSSINTSGVKGVTWHKGAGKWMAQIGAHGQHHYLGLFATIEDAKAAYDAAALRMHGAFASG